MSASSTRSRPHLTHVALWTSEIQRSVDFYRKYCDLEVVHDRTEADGGRVVWVGESKRPRFVIVLIRRPMAHTAPNSFAHFGFCCRSREEVDEHARLARSDGILELEPRDAGPIVGYFCMIRDPDGNSVEFSFGQAIDPGAFERKSSIRRRSA
ncbi:MAG: VOC family protein [Candidatus Binatia bacterium]